MNAINTITPSTSSIFFKMLFKLANRQQIYALTEHVTSRTLSYIHRIEEIDFFLYPQEHSS